MMAGVKIAFGSDIAISERGSPAGHGNNAREILFAIEAGTIPLQAIEACTATAPETLGLQAPLSGKIKAGYDADLIAVAGNPQEDIIILLDSTNVTHIWRGRALVKAPGVAVYLVK